MQQQSSSRFPGVPSSTHGKANLVSWVRQPIHRLQTSVRVLTDSVQVEAYQLTMHQQSRSLRAHSQRTRRRMEVQCTSWIVGKRQWQTTRSPPIRQISREALYSRPNAQVGIFLNEIFSHLENEHGLLHQLPSQAHKASCAARPSCPLCRHVIEYTHST